MEKLEELKKLEKKDKNKYHHYIEYQAHLTDLEGLFDQAEICPLADAQNQFIQCQTNSYIFFINWIKNLTLLNPDNKNYPGPKFSREDLEVLSSGKISSRFGDWFCELDQYEKLIRMPQPPLLLADSVLGIDAKPGSFEKGTIWTETNVKKDSWYLHQGRMPPGIMIESGQADLLLISWLGFDFYNKGERVYRLLGCELTFYGELPQPGDTLLFDIHIDAHAKQGDIRLFFFHYDCHVNQQLRMKVRQGQAGFFTAEELKNSGGVLWSPENKEFDETLPVQQPVIISEFKKFTSAQIRCFSNHNPYQCFGEKFEILQTHTRTPCIPKDRLLLINQITHFDIHGSPWKRGYMRAVQEIQPDHWFFKGHFKNDPCMPGTLMLEAGLQVMMFYMTATGCTLNKDGWRFEPVPEKTYKLTCRGQVTPASKKIVYEIFVYSFILHPSPVLYADLLGTVDGLKAFHTKIGLRLVPDWPLDTQDPLLACAAGRPSDAFGEMYKVFDTGKRVARLPAPPYHFISRIININAKKNSIDSNAQLTVEWDIDPAAWYFQQNSSAHILPFCVLLEAGLQPCGWLAAYLGCALTSDEELFYRNLDGTGTLHRDITPQDKTIKTDVICKNISRMGKILIIDFEVQCYINNSLIYNMNTVFGFFPAVSFEQQEGLVIPNSEKKALEDSDFLVDLKKYSHQLLPKTGLLMLDKITGYWPNEGSRQRGLMRAEKKVDAGEWFFKAHFFQDPVQPGSLGIEAMIQLVQFYMLYKKYDQSLKNPLFEALPLTQAVTWKYRGQVLPKNKLIYILIDILAEKFDLPCCISVTVSASLWVDNKRIYEIKNLSVNLKAGEPE